MRVRGDTVKAELSDTEGLGFKLEERQKDILQLKTALKMKVHVLYLTSDVHVYTSGIMEKSVQILRLHTYLGIWDR